MKNDRTPVILIRHARPGDERALDGLAQRDSQPPLAGEVLLGEVDGIPRAAVALDDGRLIADPFTPTAELAKLLRVRVGQLNDRTRRRRALAHQH